MRISHIAIWADNLDLLCSFYAKYFGMICGDTYVNPKKNFTSRILSFDTGETCLEMMHMPGLKSPVSRGNLKGLAHFSISVGSGEAVDSLTERLRKDGYVVLSEPRMTGDGFYESAIADPEGNYVEITV